MKAIADIQVFPIGKGTSLSEEISTCERILKEAGLNPRLHAHGTNVEGEWETVVAALRKCHEALHENGVQRVSSSLKISTRTDREETIDSRLESVMSKS